MAVVVGLLVTLAGCSGADDGPGSASDPGGEPASQSAALELTVDPAAAQAKCMVPNAEVLATQDTAFEGTVTALSDGTATLSVEQWYAGDTGTDTATVTTPSERLQDLLVAVDFQEGRTYLVSSLDGRVSLCGFTAESTPELEALYADAFSA